MSERRALLDTAAFLDSAESLRVSGASTEQLRTIVQRFLSSCYEDVGKAPKHLDGADLQALLCEHLPRRFAARDPLGAVAEEVLTAYFAYLHGREVVFAAYEQRTAFDQHIDTFRTVVASGAAHADGRLVGKGKTIEIRGDKVGRNDPCPCGSGKKFKKCCARLGDE